ncbi:MAG: nucleotidyltransferase domain-containing protein [Nanoarchaeota archaeon]|nr:nucleotidyltransferase domain-containing protein [Nanoarchaeota archaeon]
MQKILKPEFIREVKNDVEVIAVLVFGSYARGEEYRDIDVCLVLDKKYSNLRMSKKKLRYSSILASKFDVHVFQQLPIYIRKRILEDNKIVLCKNEDLLYEIAFSTIKEFEFYKKIYYTYLGMVENEN